MKHSRFQAFFVSLFLTLGADAAEQLFRDEFRGRLGDGWTILREDREAWRTTADGLEVRLLPGNMWGGANDAKNTFVRAAPDPSDEPVLVSVRFENRPTEQYEQVDLVWYYDDGHQVKIGQELVDGKLSVVMGREEADKTRTIAIIPLDSFVVDVRFRVDGHRIAGSFRTPDKPAWTDAGNCDLPVKGPPKISLQVYQGTTKVERWAKIRAFEVSRESGSARAVAATGPLRVLESNPRWFTDGSGRAVYLTGSHVWQSLQDNGLLIRGAVSNPPAVFDYEGYLAFLERHHHNFFRLWRWETPKWTDKYTGSEVKYCRPHPWIRTGPENANDGQPKFDLSQFDPEYFGRLRTRVTQARDRGIYASVMLFEGWEIQFSDAWDNHPFHAANNVNGVEADTDGDGRGLEFNTLAGGDAGRRVLELQEAYIRKVIDTVNDLDNVLYEVCNEAHTNSTEWQYHVIRFVKDYESGKPRQHPVGMTFQYQGGSNTALFESPADWISPNQGDAKQSYRDDPCSTCTTKVVVNDTDHLWGHTGGDNIWVWRSFMRGLNVLFMEEVLPSPTWQDSARQAMGQVRRWSERMNLAAMSPNDALSGTRYCLADRGREYLVFQSNKGEFTLDLKDATGPFETEWFDVNGDRTLPGRPVTGGAVRTFTTPFPGPAALYLKRVE